MSKHNVLLMKCLSYVWSKLKAEKIILLLLYGVILYNDK